MQILIHKDWIDLLGWAKQGKRGLFGHGVIKPESSPQVLKYLTWTLLASLALFQLVPCHKICSGQEYAHFFPARIEVLYYKCLRAKTCFMLLVKHHSCPQYCTNKITVLGICFSVEAAISKNREACCKLVLSFEESHPMAHSTCLVLVSGASLSPSTHVVPHHCFVVSQIRIILWGKMKLWVSTLLLCGYICT